MVNILDRFAESVRIEDLRAIARFNDIVYLKNERGFVDEQDEASFLRCLDRGDPVEMPSCDVEYRIGLSELRAVACKELSRRVVSS